MKKINGFEKILERTKTWKPSDIVFITELIWSFDKLTISFLSQHREDVSTWPDYLKKFCEIKIEFARQRNVKLNFANHALHQISGFDFIDISENNLEDINFQIDDYENGSISFFCKEINVVFVSEPRFIDFKMYSHL